MKPQNLKWRQAVKTALQRAAYVVGGISILLGVMPIPFMVFNTGAAAFLLFGVAAILTAALWDRFDGWGRVPRRLHEVSDLRRPPAPRWWRMTRLALSLCLVLALAGGGVLSLAMGAAIGQTPGENATVVVLGCRVYGDQPSLMLQRRLNAALEYLNIHPQAAVVCSGGQTAGDPYSEAAVMANYLVQRGVSPERIYLEEQSASTAQNIGNSAEIIRQNGLPLQIAIATDGFHELRAQLYARKNGLDGRALPAVTPWGIAPAYWVREWFGLAKAVVFG